MPRSEAQSRLIFVIFVDLSLRIFTVCHYFFPLVTKVPLPPQKTQGPFGATISCASGWLIPSVALPKVTRCHGAMVPWCHDAHSAEVSGELCAALYLLHVQSGFR